MTTCTPLTFVTLICSNFPLQETSSTKWLLYNPGHFVPTDIARNGKGQIFVTDEFSSSVGGYSPNGTLLYLFTQYNGNNFSCPPALAFDSDDNMYLLDEGTSQYILKIEVSTANVLQVFGKGHFSNLFDFTVDTSGSVYGLDGVEVLKFDSKGNYLFSFGGNQIFSFPVSMDSDTQNNIFVFDANYNLLFKFNSNGTLLLNFSTPNAYDFTLTPQDTLLLCFNDASCKEYDSNGNLLANLKQTAAILLFAPDICSYYALQFTSAVFVYNQTFENNINKPNNNNNNNNNPNNNTTSKPSTTLLFSPSTLVASNWEATNEPTSNCYYQVPNCSFCSQVGIPVNLSLVNVECALVEGVWTWVYTSLSGLLRNREVISIEGYTLIVGDYLQTSNASLLFHFSSLSGGEELFKVSGKLEMSGAIRVLIDTQPTFKNTPLSLLSFNSSKGGYFNASLFIEPAYTNSYCDTLNASLAYKDNHLIYANLYTTLITNCPTSKNIALIVGLAVGLGGGVLITLIIVFFLFCSNKKKQQDSSGSSQPKEKPKTSYDAFTDD